MEKFNQSKYINEYKRSHYKRVSLQLNLEKDADIIKKLESVENVNEFIKQLIRTSR